MGESNCIMDVTVADASRFQLKRIISRQYEQMGVVYRYTHVVCRGG